MNSKEETNDSTQAPIVIRSKDFQTIYANFVQGAYTAFDISLLLGGVFPEVGHNSVVDIKARAVFSPIEAKLLIRILRSMVLSYEKQFGKIVIPESVSQISSSGNAIEIPTDDDSEAD